MSRICVVTGVTRGIGYAIAKMLLEAGYEVVGLARSRPDWWHGDFIECDLLDREKLVHACQRIRKLDNLWALVNNAGIGHADSLAEISLDDMVRVFFVNTFAPALLAQASASAMRQGGRIVNICSNTMLGKAHRNIYASSKAALVSLTRTWALELGPRGITVNAISPGPIETDLFRSRNPAGPPNEQELLRGIPIGKFGQPEQIASFTVLLIDPQSDYCTGQVIYVDGGASVGRSIP